MGRWHAAGFILATLLGGPFGLVGLNDAHGKTGSTWLSGRLGALLNDPFISANTYGASVGFQLTERFAVRAKAVYFSSAGSDLATFLETEGIDLKRADLSETINSYEVVEALFNLTREDVLVTPYVGLGAGLIQSLYIPADNPNGEDMNNFVLPITLGLNWHLTERLSLRSELNALVYARSGAGMGYGADASDGSTALEFSLSLGYEFSR